MPLYEYHCRECERDFELLVRGNEAVSCPECASNQLEKLLSVPATPAGSNQELPVCRPQNFGGCGAPQCGMGQCGM